MIRLLAGVLLAIATLPMASTGAWSGDPQSGAAPSVLVQLTKLKEGSLPKVVEVFGKIEASAAARQDVTAPAAAAVEDVFVKPGQEVKASAPLIRLGATSETAAAYQRAASAQTNARDLLQRSKTLLAQHLATRQQVADAEKALEDAQASLSALSSGGASEPRTLSAPHDGVVTQVSVSRGAVVSPGTALLTIAQTNGLVLRAGAVPEQAEEIHQGDTAEISSVGGGDTGVGTVLLRGSIVDLSTGLVPVEIGASDGDFLPGQTAEARVVVGAVHGYVVPHETVLVNQQGAPYVVQVKNKIAHEVLVTILLSAGAQDVIAGKLDPEAALVLAGNYQLKDGMHVRLADANQPDAK